MVLVPVCFGGNSGIIEFVVLEEDIPPLLPVGFLERLGALIDIPLGTISVKTLDATEPMSTLAPGHRALEIVLSQNSEFEVNSESLRHWTGVTLVHFRRKSANHKHRNSRLMFSSYSVHGGSGVQTPTHHHVPQRPPTMPFPFFGMFNRGHHQVSRVLGLIGDFHIAVGSSSTLLDCIKMSGRLERESTKGAFVGEKKEHDHQSAISVPSREAEVLGESPRVIHSLSDLWHASLRRLARSTKKGSSLDIVPFALKCRKLPSLLDSEGSAEIHP